MASQPPFRHAVSYSRLGEDVRRVSRIVAQLAAEPLDDGACGSPSRRCTHGPTPGAADARGSIPFLR